ncbi:SDR family oxidoreductase [Asanoa sp. NPDC049518]|uniref:SDR family oxidoreductase n=1 Tax=unclassified Asanoa TaxID=2685164 RepID=UPI00343E5C0C
MKIDVIGGTGMIGSKVVTLLRDRGHDVVAAAPNTGVNTLTGEGLAEALDGASVVVDVSNSRSFDGDAALEFFETSMGNLRSAETAAGVRHHVALSVVGADRMLDSGYMRAKVAQERMVAESDVPYSVVRATQFFEFLKAMTDAATDGDTVHLAPVAFRPIAADDVAGTVADVALGTPVNGVVEVAGPEQSRFDQVIRSNLPANDPREVVADPTADYFGAVLAQNSLVPGPGARIATTTLSDWRAARG